MTLKTILCSYTLALILSQESIARTTCPPIEDQLIVWVDDSTQAKSYLLKQNQWKPLGKSETSFQREPWPSNVLGARWPLDIQNLSPALQRKSDLFAKFNTEELRPPFAVTQDKVAPLVAAAIASP